MRTLLQGSMVALITPMDAKGEVNWTELERLTEWHIKQGTDAIIAVGTTGESATLSIDEHIEVIRRVASTAQGRCPIIAGTGGGNNTRDAVAFNKRISSFDVAACLTVTPYYNKPSQQGLYQHYKTICENSAIPQILYNVPGRTGVDLQPVTVARLAELPQIIGLKDATGDLLRVRIHRELCGTDFPLFSGDDGSTLEFMKLGGRGCISVTANIAAKKMKMMMDYALSQSWKQAEIVDNQLRPLHELLFCQSNPIPVKWVAAQIGLIENGTLRLPLVELSVECQNQLKPYLTLCDDFEL